ncbi:MULTISPECIES: hypothetical protein [unclassified Empedobacter]|uniref:hypothetical protein n=1 Tax=unclassified Empedobacter TaxID=2643773 RepID=UPI0025C27656|nr:MULTISPECIES: hypothetical protein [unclassified Empedobacter]
MEKILIHRDQNTIDEKISDLEIIVEKVQNIIDDLAVFASIELIKDVKELTTIYRNPKKFFIDLLVIEEETMQGFPLSKEKVFDLLELPESAKNLIEEYSQNQKDKWETEAVFFQYLEIVNKKVQIKQSHIEDLDKQYSIYITSDNQKLVWDKLNNITQILTEIQPLVLPITKSTRISINHLSDLFKVDHSGFAINGDLVFIPNPKIINHLP